MRIRRISLGRVLYRGKELELYESDQIENKL